MAQVKTRTAQDVFGDNILADVADLLGFSEPNAVDLLSPIGMVMGPAEHVPNAIEKFRSKLMKSPVTQAAFGNKEISTVDNLAFNDFIHLLISNDVKDLMIDRLMNTPKGRKTVINRMNLSEKSIRDMTGSKAAKARFENMMRQSAIRETFGTLDPPFKGTMKLRRNRNFGPPIKQEQLGELEKEIVQIMDRMFTR